MHSHNNTDPQIAQFRKLLSFEMQSHGDGKLGEFADSFHQLCTSAAPLLCSGNASSETHRRNFACFSDGLSAGQTGGAARKIVSTMRRHDAR